MTWKKNNRFLLRQSPLGFLCFGLLALSCNPTQPKPLTDEVHHTRGHKEESASSKKYKLVLLVVIDQLPSWSFTNDITTLQGGLYNLVSKGHFVERALIQNASSFTAPGHALIGTGSNPAQSGVLANSWYDIEKNAQHVVARDTNTKLFNLDGSLSEHIGSSSVDLKVDGISEALKKNSPNSKSISLGLKDRATVHMTGRKPDLAIWYDDELIGFTTSNFYTDTYPQWLKDYNTKNPVKKRLNETWTRSLDRYPGYGSDDLAGEGETYGFDTTFPHELSKSTSPEKAMRATPVGVDVTFSLAEAALKNEKLGQDNHTDLLAITISSHDYAGHVWGQESWERYEMLRHIDKALGGFLKRLDATVGKNQYAVVVTSDHGATPLVEQSQLKGLDAHRVPVKDILEIVNSSIFGIVGPGEWTVGLWANTLYFTQAFHALPQDRKDKAFEIMMERLKKVPGIGHVGLTSKLVGNCKTKSPKDALACNALREKGSGALYIGAKDYSLPKGNYTTGTGHGGPATHDREVPLIVWAPGKTKHQTTQATIMENVAPTVTTLLGIPKPSKAQGISIVK